MFATGVIRIGLWPSSEKQIVDKMLFGISQDMESLK
jgi:hypothetical protein